MPRTGGLLERQRCDRIGAFAVGRPRPGFLPAGPPSLDIDPVGDHERRIEPMPNWPISCAASAPGPPSRVFSASLPSRASPGFSFSRKARVPELAIVPSACTRSSASIPMPLSVIASVLASLSIVRTIVKGTPSAAERRVGERFVAQLFAGVRGIRDELAQENVAFGIDRMHHQAQKARDIGLKCM